MGFPGLTRIWVWERFRCPPCGSYFPHWNEPCDVTGKGGRYGHERNLPAERRPHHGRRLRCICRDSFSTISLEHYARGKILYESDVFPTLDLKRQSRSQFGQYASAFSGAFSRTQTTNTSVARQDVLGFRKYLRIPANDHLAVVTLFSSFWELLLIPQL